MAHSVAPEVIARTIWCRKDFACLQEGRCENCAQCVIEGENAINALFLRKRESSGCPYYFDFGSGYLCTCPTRYALYKKNGY
jgi:hypothetical protein